METLIPKQVFFVKGAGKHFDRLSSFELALRQAKIERYNLVYVSSILPPKCKIAQVSSGLKFFSPGQIMFCVMSRNETNEPGRLISASVGVAVPSNKEDYGYLSEYHAFGETDEKAGDKAEDIAACLLASTLGVDFDACKNWDEKKEIFKMSGRIVKTSNVTQSSKGDREGRYTTVIAAACFVL